MMTEKLAFDGTEKHFQQQRGMGQGWHRSIQPSYLTILQNVGKFGRWSMFNNALQCKDTVTSFKQNMY